MNVHSSLFGIHVPGDGWLFRLGTGWKYLVLLAITLPTFWLWQWWSTAAALVLVVVLLRSSGIGLRRIFAVGGMLWTILAVLAVYQLLTGRPDLAFISPGSVLAAVLAARMLTLTTSTADLLDALVRALQPLRWVRIDPERVGLAVAIMVRSVPYVLGAFSETRDAARARGRDGNVISLLVPTMVASVAYAQRTGDALHARGLGERDA